MIVAEKLEAQAYRNGFLTSAQIISDYCLKVANEFPHITTAAGFVLGKNVTVPKENLVKRRHLMLVDPGTLKGLPYLLHVLKKAGIDLAEIDIITNTHFDSDHAEVTEPITSLITAARHGDRPQVVAPKGTKEHIIATGNPLLTANLFYNKPFVPAHIDREVGDRDVIPVGEFEVDVISSPGHHPLHVSLLLPDLLLAGDALEGNYILGRSDIDQMNDTVDKLFSYRFSKIGESHGYSPFLDRRLAEERRRKLARTTGDMVPGIFKNLGFKDVYNVQY